MDHLERIGALRRRLVPAGLMTAAAVVALAATGCIADDRSTATLDDGAGTLPAATSARAPDAASGAADGTAEATGERADDGIDDGAVNDTASAGPASTTPPRPLLGLAADELATGFDQPVLVLAVPGTDDLVVVEREGIAKLVSDGDVVDRAFLDVRELLLSSSIEQGLLGLAFHPDYERNRRLFAYWTDVEGDSVLAELAGPDPAELASATAAVDDAAPPMVDNSTIRVLLTIDQPAERHNAGHLTFGPDGLLYAAVGDGGSGGSTAQDLTNLLGSILRIDVSEPGRHAIPPDNPYGDEIWATGLRNPWRFSIDESTGLVYIGDVGQEAFEEIDVVPLDEPGANFGWFEMEGDQCFRSGCDPTGYVAPVLQYDHATGCSVTGGFVYRGAAIPEMDGRYVFADWCVGFVRSFRYADGNAVDQVDHTADLAALGQVTSFGLDHDGELLAVDWEGGLYRIVPVR